MKRALLKADRWYWYCPADWCEMHRKEQQVDDDGLKYKGDGILEVECSGCGHDYMIIWNEIQNPNIEHEYQEASNEDIPL